MAENNDKVAVKPPVYRNSWVWGIGVLILLVVLLGAGMFWRGQSRYGYYGGGMMGRNILPYSPHRGYGGMMGGFGYTQQGATSGTIGKISGNEITVNATNGVSQSVLVTGSTKITRNSADIKLSDLKTNDQVTVYGYPNAQNQIQATLIQAQ